MISRSAALLLLGEVVVLSRSGVSGTSEEPTGGGVGRSEEFEIPAGVDASVGWFSRGLGRSSSRTDGFT
jgi:hypothetical protein